MGVVPEVRARHLKQTLAAADRLPAREQVRGSMKGATISDIERSHGFDWLPVAYDVELVRAIHEALGPEAHDAFSRAVVLHAFEGPLLAPILRLAMVVKGPDLGGWMSWLPKGWSLVFRGCGEWSVERTWPRGAELVLAGMAPACFDDPIWPGSVASSLSALPAWLGVRGRMRLDGKDPERRSARYVFDWEAPA